LNSSSENIVIVGAGLAGALLACLLGKAGHEVAVYERRPDPREKGFLGGRSINLALSARGIHALSLAGLAERVLNEAISMRGRMIHSVAGRLSFQPYSTNPRDAINSVSRGGLNEALLKKASGYAGVRYYFEHRCVGVDLERPAVTLSAAENRTVDADVVIGCDGAFSAVRGEMQRLDRFDCAHTYLEHGYKELTIPPAADGGFAMEPHALHIWPRGGFMMIALPNRDRSFTCTLFWPFAGPRSFEAVRSDDDILRFFGVHFPDAMALMPALVEEYLRNPIASLVTVRCAPWFHRDRVVLVGDAAHAIVPFYGQGMNAAFEDCVVLAESLDLFPHDRQVALQRYYGLRKTDADAIGDLAIANFLEMRDRVASPLFRLRKKSERVLHRLLPRWYTPLYNMVSFSRIPYAQARRRATQQRRIVVAILTVLLLLAVIGVVWLFLVLIAKST